jgi:hypothetical protein
LIGCLLAPLTLIPKKKWRKNKTHGRADAAGLTSEVIAQKDLAAKEKAEKAEATKAVKAPNAAALTATKAKARVESAGEEDLGLPPSTAPPKARGRRRQEEPWTTLHCTQARQARRPGPRRVLRSNQLPGRALSSDYLPV